MSVKVRIFFEFDEKEKQEYNGIFFDVIYRI